MNRLRIGNFGDCKPIEGGVFELKIDYGPGYRIYIGRYKKEVVILLCGGDKSSQRDDIRQALMYWKEYQEEHAG